MNDGIKRFFYRIRILPVLVIVASLTFVVRVGDAYVGMKSLSGSAYAEESKPADAKPTEEKAVDTPKPTADTPAEKAPDVSADAAPQPPVTDLKEKTDAADDKGPADVTLPTTGDDKKAAGEPTTDKKWADASDGDDDAVGIKKEMYQDLSKRRAEIEQKEKKLSEREALLEAAQKELDRKLTEMEGLRDEIKGLLKQQSADEAARIESLVKIYSGMKPKDAARIFNTLDTDILMDVISHMPESKAGLIMALMDADRAKALTTLLAEQKKLPDVQ